MRPLHQSLIIAALLATPLSSHADDTTPLTRDQVQNELVVAELSAQFPTSKTHYPAAAPNRAAMYVAYKSGIRGGYQSSPPNSSNSVISRLRSQF
jgi:hypothetical protein